MQVRQKILHNVVIDGGFWGAFRDTAVKKGIPYQWEALNDRVGGAEPSCCMTNFRIAAGLESGQHHGFVFQDSDAAKWLEAVAYSLRWHPDDALEALADSAIELIVASQQPDGYMDTYYIINGLDRRWTNLKDSHELYCAGHFIEAAVAYWRVTGKRVLLDAILRLVDHIDRVIGPEPEKLHGYPGHPVIEMALMKLYEVTGDKRHLRLAQYFIDQRGQKPLYFEREDAENGNRFYWENSPFRYQYYQAGLPVREQLDAEGHAVRALYLYSGMADVAAETGDESLKLACERLWQSVTRRRMYVTGAVGSSEYGESFTFDYDLPNDTVYGETCASVALVFFAHRMLRMQPRGEYADVMERALYNGVISGMQLDGTRFFYVNPLEVLPIACEKDAHKRHVKPQRQPWFGCACCPPNLIRLLTSLEDYVATQSGDTLFVNLYARGRICTDSMALNVITEYPWQGDIRIEIDASTDDESTIALRIPGWCRNWSMHINGQRCLQTPEEGYVYLKRTWEHGNVIDLNLDMPPRLVRANPAVSEDAGKVALMRGPIIYCLEQIDNGPHLHRLVVEGAVNAEVKWSDHLPSGIMSITLPGLRETDAQWGDRLYGDFEPEYIPAALKFIPYYAWANRDPGEMRVWIRKKQ